MKKLLFKFLESRLEKWFYEKTKTGQTIPVVFYYTGKGSKEPALVMGYNYGKPENLLVFTGGITFIATDVCHADFKKEGLPYWDKH